MAAPPPESGWRGRYQGLSKRALPGCGCLAIWVVLLLVWWFMASSLALPWSFMGN
jgi:hypothetical protein